MRQIKLSSIALKFQHLGWIDYILVISPLRLGIPHRLTNSLPTYKFHHVLIFLFSSLTKSSLKCLLFFTNVLRYKSKLHNLLDYEMLLEILTDNADSFYKEKPDKSFKYLNVARIIPNGSGVLCPTDLIKWTDIPIVLILVFKEQFIQLVKTLKTRGDLSLKHKTLIIAWKIRHIQDFMAAKCLELSNVNIKVYVDWFENQVIDATISSALSKRNCKVYYVSDYLVDVDWHLNLNPRFWHSNNNETHFGAIINQMQGTGDMSWWSTRLFRNKILEAPISNRKRVIFIYPFQEDLARQLAIIQKEFAQTQSKNEILVKKHPNSSFQVAVGEETDVFYKSDTIVSIQTSLLTELYHQGVRDIAVVKLKEHIETGLPKGTYRIIKEANEIVN